MTIDVVLVAGAAATWAMVGLIWLVQVVHYPLLGQLSALSPANAATVAALISGNWIRTLAWTARGMILAEVLAS